jgi:hypothetical protein
VGCRIKLYWIKATALRAAAGRPLRQTKTEPRIPSSVIASGPFSQDGRRAAGGLTPLALRVTYGHQAAAPLTSFPVQGLDGLQAAMIDK